MFRIGKSELPAVGFVNPEDREETRFFFISENLWSGTYVKGRAWVVLSQTDSWHTLCYSGYDFIADGVKS